ncbi:MAG: hypothetical protein LBR26_11325, partial [Prevotella sp.]|nr:hypothetical protein [Prevotella sp.]
TNINDDPDPAVLASYTPKAHKGFAGSNIYWDATNQRLTFDDVDVTTHKNYQGLYFKWGSLIGISPSGTWGGATVLYSPDGINGMYRTTTASALVAGTWANIAVGDATNFSTTPIDGVTDYRTNGYVSFLNATPANLIAYKGDICAYLSGRPGVPAGYWRLPVSADFEPDTFPDAFVSPGQYTMELGELSVWPSSAGTSNKTDGTFEVANGYTLAYGGSSTVFFPASGLRNLSTGALNDFGVTGYAWSSSADAARGRSLFFSGATVNPANSNDRANGFPARCVKK